jgi:hypothetical protein
MEELEEWNNRGEEHTNNAAERGKQEYGKEAKKGEQVEIPTDLWIFRRRLPRGRIIPDFAQLSTSVGFEISHPLKRKTGDLRLRSPLGPRPLFNIAINNRVARAISGHG